MSLARDNALMAQALRLARRGLYSTHPNPRVGCVVVQGDTVVGEGWHQRAGEPHAEVYALRQAGERARGATAYVTLEPCSHQGRTPPCAEALVQAGIARVVIAVQDANPRVAGSGIQRLRDAGIRVDVGVLESDARALNFGFLRRMAGGLPRVRLKVAASLDGRTAMASGESQWITGPRSRDDVHRLRAQSDTIVTGVGTVLDDDPSLTVRLSEVAKPSGYSAPVEPPWRVVLDPRLRMPPEARMLNVPGTTWVICSPQASPSARQALEQAGARVQVMASQDNGRVHLPELLRWLADQGRQEVLMECGATLAGAALQSQVVDELWLYQAPVFLGSEGRPLASLPLQSMGEKLTWNVADRRQIGTDIRWILTPEAAVSEGSPTAPDGDCCH